MTKTIKLLCFMFLVSASVFADINFIDPKTTPEGIVPNISRAGGNAQTPQIATSNEGKYVYTIWNRSNGTNYRTQVSVSSDYGMTWVDPKETPAGTTPDISRAGGNALRSSIATNSTGQFVYAIWKRSNGTYNIIQVAHSSDYGMSWVDPKVVPLKNVSPDISVSNQNSDQPQITTDASGQYVYATWLKFNGSNNIVQVAISSDYGMSWVYPKSVITSEVTPDLSRKGQNANLPYIICDKSGKYVYVIWARSNGTNNIIQVAISSDYGMTFADPQSTPSGNAPDLSRAGQSALECKIISDNSGQYVYAIWNRYNGSNYAVEIAISSDYGKSWVDPKYFPTVDFNQILTFGDQNCNSMNIATNSTGQFVYAIWRKNIKGTDGVIQVAISSDYGFTWERPTTTPNKLISPNLTPFYQNVNSPYISTDASGKNVYAIWSKYNGKNFVIQAAVSFDYGLSWDNPANVPSSNKTPSISRLDQNAIDPDIISDGSGKHFYATWVSSSDDNNIVQVATGVTYTLNAPFAITPNVKVSFGATLLNGDLFQVFGTQVRSQFPFKIEITNKLAWNYLSFAKRYNIYTDAAKSNRIAVVYNPNLEYLDHQIRNGITKNYYITWVDQDDTESTPVQVTLP